MRRLFAIAAAVVLAPAALGACGGGDADDGTREKGLPVVEVPARWATAIASSVPALTDASDVVFMGRVARPLPQRLEHLPGRANGGAGTEFPISAFEVAVESVMSGSLTAGTTVVVEQAGGTEHGPDGAYTVVLEQDELIRPGWTYIFFATWKENGTLTAPPFGRFAIGQDGKVDAPGVWQRLPAAQELAGLQMAAAVAEIEAAGE